MNTTDNSSIEMPVDGDNATHSSSEQPTELQQLANNEVKELVAEIEELKAQIKDKQKRVRELQKKPASNGPIKKVQAENWLFAHPDSTLLDFINYAVGELDISPVYASTVFKQVQKPKTKQDTYCHGRLPSHLESLLLYCGELKPICGFGG